MDLKIIKDKILKVDKVEWRRFKFIQQSNFKELSKDDFQKIKNSITKNGFIEEFKVYQENDIIYCLDGYHRCLVLDQLQSEGYAIPDKMTASFIDCKNKEEAAHYIGIYSSVYARVTEDGLYEFMNKNNIDPTEFFAQTDIAYINQNRFADDYFKDTSKEEIEDEVPEVKQTDIKLGDMFQLGNHRLMCGDCTIKENVEKLMNGEKAVLVTDPPYGIDLDFSQQSYGANKLCGNGVAKRNEYKKIENDTNIDIINNIIPIIELYFKDYVLFGANYFCNLFKPSKCWIAWYKKENLPSDSFCDLELAYTTFLKHSKVISVQWKGMIKEGEAGQKRVHPTQKPILLFEKIYDYLSIKENICDLFAGSGSTLIACEKTNRKCYCMEIDPQYCQVIIDRYKQYTGRDDVIKL